MSKDIVVHLKQTGEDLGSPEQPIDAEAIQMAAFKIKDLQQPLGHMGVAGLMVVPGGGNIMRGRSFKADQMGPTLKRRTDPAGRWGTAINAWLLGAALTDLGVPNKVFMAPGMEVVDPSMEFEPYSLDAVNEAYRQGRVVLAAGGDGRDGGTTDAALVRYALDQRRAYKRYGCVPTAYKATNVDGIYSADPNIDQSARFIPEITAREAQAKGLGVVDPRCMGLLASAVNGTDMPRFGLRVYSSEKHSLVDVMRSETAGAPLGSLLLAGSN